MKIIFKIIAIFFVSLILLISYLSLVGFETQRFNNEIVKKIEEIDDNFEVEIKGINIVLSPFEYKLNAKTIGPKLKLRNSKKTIEIENIKTQIPLKSFFKKKFIVENLEVSTKSLEIKNLISFARIFYKDPELYILEKIVKKGYLVADIKLDFDENGNIKDNYEIKGLVKEAKIDIFNKYNVDDLDFIFNFNKNFINVKSIKLLFNNLKFTSENLDFKKNKDFYFIKGDFENKNIFLEKNNLQLFIKPILTNLDLEKIKFNSKNKFSTKLSNKLKFSDFALQSEIELEELLISNKLKLDKFLPKLSTNIKFLNHNLKINYKKNKLSINGKGGVQIQENIDELNYSIIKKSDILKFKSTLKVQENPFQINFLDYKKIEKNDAILSIEGNRKSNLTSLKLLSYKEGKNFFKINDLILNEKLNVKDFKKIEISFIDEKDFLNKYNILKKNNVYQLTGPSFNADNLIENIISDKKKKDIIDKNFKLKIQIDNVILDDNHNLKDLSGILSFKNQEITDGNLVGFFSNNEKLQFTMKSLEGEKITTLFLDQAGAIVSRYKFIKGFEEGLLDFYSSNKGQESVSTLKIYDFKLKELPALTKLLTLASLQGIADLLSGEGIRFNEFEMNFSNKGSLIKIDEIYAIGPAISILMSGYVEKEKLISLRGTLVPATTLNKAIGSIPFLGNILVGKKTGEGVFGVSFKIKGPPENLETTVNPIKTLTPRFITRTLEKIKKN